MTGVNSSINGYHNSGGAGYITMAANTQENDLAVAQNGSNVSKDNVEAGEMDGDEEDLDDDMMDKISSSPSIDDGGSTCQLSPLDSLAFGASPCSSPASASLGQARSSSPYLDLPVYLPLQQKHSNTGNQRRHHLLLHKQSSGPTYDYPPDFANKESMDIKTNERKKGISVPGYEGRISQSASDETERETPEMLQTEIDLKFNVHVERVLNDTSSDLDAIDLIVPYEDTNEEEDDDDDPFFQSQNSRFIDSGWGGDSLQDTEDIDFELVYALHTFIATVEGQANATKGDAMVLLDDSNSYWWLVRVVKDSSIGEKGPKNYAYLIDCY